MLQRALLVLRHSLPPPQNSSHSYPIHSHTTHSLTGAFLTIVCLAVAVGAVLSEEMAAGMAMVSGSEGYASVKLGLWHGKSQTAGRSEVFRYQWCEVDSPSYHGPHCTQLQVARTGACMGVCILVALVVLLALLITYAVRMRFEGRLTRVAAGLCATASLCFAVCLGMWAMLVLSLSEKGEDSKAQLSIGMSWLAEGGAFILAFLLTVNMLQTARRIDHEAMASTLKVEKKASAGAEGGKASAVAVVAGGGESPRKPEKHRAGRRSHGSHGGGDLEA